MSDFDRITGTDPNWLTPLPIVEAARKALGGKIDLDPASSAEANVQIDAEAYFQAGYDGLHYPWRGAVFLNPPGGRAPKGLRSGSNAVCWWLKLLDELRAGRTVRAVFVAFASEAFTQAVQLADDACFDPPGRVLSIGIGPRARFRSDWPLHYHCFWPAERIRFEQMRDGVRVPGPQPTHGNVIVGLGMKASQFAEAFAPLRGVTMAGVQ